MTCRDGDDDSNVFPLEIINGSFTYKTVAHEKVYKSDMYGIVHTYMCNDVYMLWEIENIELTASTHTVCSKYVRANFLWFHLLSAYFDRINGAFYSKC